MKSSNSANKISVFKLYDKIETHLRASESLKVTTEKYASMLYPLVVACLPDYILRIWERNLASADKGSLTNKLELLMTFLKKEVEGEERITMVRQGFNVECRSQTKAFPKHKHGGRQNEIPTAAGLLNNELTKAKPTKKVNCIFCGENHNCVECKSARCMYLDQRKQILLKKGVCFTRLTPSNLSKDCRKFVKCTNCFSKYYLLMCPNVSKCRETEKDKHDQKVEITGHTLTNQTSMPEVLMQTLKVRIHGNQNQQLIRALVDTGSQRSYIMKELASDMGYKSVGEGKMKLSLFRGTKLLKEHKKYHKIISNIEGTYKCIFEVNDQKEICAAVKSVTKGMWMK
ncbi:uncharacterized protein LOC118189329 [Stegodyphus dumicola]|uniref:uncharacterized protein LOC118189329 n=1 Tax=Stegodyphus dumicola TaxID=202533 RepID=UPI0015B312C6|nr:uncharacterized protein LOC118189329 [Stegodyphus dumicola]